MKSSPASATEGPCTNKTVQMIFTKLRIVKNLVFLSIGCFFSFCAYDGLAVLQSTLNRKDGIGVTSVSIQYGCGCLAALLFAKYFLKKFGSKSVILVTSVSYVIYVAANFHPSWYLLIPASVLVGLANSLFWAAQCQYLNGLAILYADHQIIDNKVGQFKREPKVQKQCGIQPDHEQTEDSNCINQSTYSHFDIFDKGNYAYQIDELNIKKRTYNAVDEPSATNSKVPENSQSVSLMIVSAHELQIVESTTSRMFGFHGFIFQTCHIWSNLMSYYVIKSGSTDNGYIRNSTCMCGANFCNVETECFLNNLQEPNDQMKYILIGIFVALSILAVLIVALFLDELEKKEESVCISLEVLFASFRHMKNKFEIFLTPYVMLVGVLQGFVMGDFTKAYIGCAWGMHHVGLVMAFFGACLALSCTLSGWFVKHVGRVPIFLIGQASIVAAGVLLLTWPPEAEDLVMFFVIAGLFGVNMGILWSQLRALYGVLFKEDEEVAFGNYNIFHSIGTSMAFGYSNLLCTSTKIYIFLTLSFIGCIGYLLAERSHSQSKSIK